MTAQHMFTDLQNKKLNKETGPGGGGAAGVVAMVPRAVVARSEGTVVFVLARASAHSTMNVS